jgi:hypothetical protein
MSTIRPASRFLSERGWPCLRFCVRGAIALALVGAIGYAGVVGVTWLRYGQAAESAGGGEADPLLDVFMPVYEVSEQHDIAIAAPADVAFSAAKEMDLFGPRPVRMIFKLRELILRGESRAVAGPRDLVSVAHSWGWGTLAEVPGHELVFGAVTRPWEANVVFRPLAPAEFVAFNEPGFVKIVWTLRVDSIDAGHCRFRTETRAVTTDPVARGKFRRYWAWVSPGVWLIRTLSLEPLKSSAERRAANS